MNKSDLINIAKEASKSAHSPYSGFCVGAALLAKCNEVFTGCNVENASFSVTCCGERVALFKAVSENVTHFTEIAIVGGNNEVFTSPCYPCGVCLQALSEFCSPDFKIHLLDGDNIITYTLKELMPHNFDLYKEGNKNA